MKKNNRYSESMAPLFDEHFHPNQQVIWMSAPSDIGVRRNRGRNGSRYAPECILNTFKKLANQSAFKEHLIYHQQVSSQLDEMKDFHKAQQTSHDIITKLLTESYTTTNARKYLHIGGGHDHAYPIMKAFESFGIEELLILNCDAHLDTRIDTIRHSGTPFRDFTNETNIKVHLHQYGIHPYANSKSTMSSLKNVNTIITYRKDCDERLSFLENTTTINWNNPKLAVYFSLDVDALESSIFEGVSAVNHDGLPLDHVSRIMEKLFNPTSNALKIFGIYEYNPIYDNLSQKGARALAQLIYKFINYL